MTPKLAVALGLALAATGLAPDKPKDPAVGTSYRVPYRMTDTNHFLVRVRINGKGPFNFLVDTGAPALFISTETAKKIELKVDDADFWTPIDRVDFEGGPYLAKVQARVEDPFQLVGMNALGLPGASIDGILGFSALARFKLELDPTQDRMTWTRLDYEPKDPFVPRKTKLQTPNEVQALNVLGPIAKLAAAMIGKQPEEQLHPQGFLGIELESKEGKVTVAKVLADSPAAKAGVEQGDRLMKISGRSISDSKGVHVAIAEVKPGESVTLSVERSGSTLELKAIAGKGF